jgi:neprilysin/putative endopeptidase
MRPAVDAVQRRGGGTAGADSLGEIVGQIFIQQRFGADAKARMDELVAALQRSLRGTLTDLDWMSAGTRKHALAKLDALSRKIGGPDGWRDFNGVTIKRDEYAGNFVRIAINETQAAAALDRTACRSQPLADDAPDRERVLLSQLNEIVFPAGILQPPFFDREPGRCGELRRRRGGDRPRALPRFRRQRAALRSEGQPDDWWDTLRRCGVPRARVVRGVAVRRVLVDSRREAQWQPDAW